MTLNDIAKKLENQRTNALNSNAKKINLRGDETYGLSISKIQEVAKGLHNDPILADELYGTQNYDMKVLATMIDDPKSYTLDELTQRANQLYPSPFAEKFCKQVLANTDHAVHFIDKWLACEDCNLQAYAYITLGEIARKSNNLSDEFFAAHMLTISETMDDQTDDIKTAMKGAVKSIAGRNEVLRKKVLHLADMGKLHLNGFAQRLAGANKNLATAAS